LQEGVEENEKVVPVIYEIYLYYEHNMIYLPVRQPASVKQPLVLSPVEGRRKSFTADSARVAPDALVDDANVVAELVRVAQLFSAQVAGKGIGLHVRL
jgi:hypothetical protein